MTTPVYNPDLLRTPEELGRLLQTIEETKREVEQQIAIKRAEIRRSGTDTTPVRSKRVEPTGHRTATAPPPAAATTPCGDPAQTRYLNTFMQAMREDRRESNRQITALIAALAGSRNVEHGPRLNKAIPQVQAMRDREDITEYFQLFETTQTARNNPPEAWASTLMPLLNSSCKSLALSLPATTQLNYPALKQELLALARAQTEYTSKEFWEHKKSAGTNWREEVAILTKLLRRCAPGPTAEEVRGQIVVEKLVQMLPRHIQVYVRERSPETPGEASDLISTYFRAHNLVETEWEWREKDSKDFKRSYGYKNQQLQHSSHQASSNLASKHTSQHSNQQPTSSHSQDTPSHRSHDSDEGASQPNNETLPSFKAKNFYYQKNYQKRDMSMIQCHNCKEYGHYAYQCVKVNVVTLPETGNGTTKQPVMKMGMIGEREHLWYMDSGADMCFIAEDLLPAKYTDCPPVHARGAMHEDGRMCPTVMFDAMVDGKYTTMLAAVAPRSLLPYPAIIGRNGTGLHIQWEVTVSDDAEKTPNDNMEQQEGGMAGETSSQELDESAHTPQPAGDEESSADKVLQQTDQHPPALPHRTPMDLENLTESDILAIQTRAQKLRQKKQEQADAHATANSGAHITSLDDVHLPSPADRPGSEHLITKDLSQPDTAEPQSQDQTAGKEEDDKPSVAVITDPFTRQDLIRAQHADAALQSLFEAAEDPDSEYMFHNDVLYAINANPAVDETPYKIVVPDVLKTKILELGHGKSGHFGSKKTRKNIQSSFYWKGIGRDIQDFCKKCKKCVAFNNHRRDVQPQQPIPVITEPWKKLAMDIVGPLTRTTTGYHYILTVIDTATRYPVAIPLKRVDTQTTCDALLSIFADFGTPEEVVHDNGGNFTAELMQQVMKTLGVHRIVTSPYHPEANGIIERFNGTLKKTLKKAGSAEKTWDKWLSYVLHVIRITPHEATGYSPFELLFGRRAETPISSLRRALEEPQPDLPRPVEDYLKQLQSKMQLAQQVAGETDQHAKDASKIYQDHKKKTVEQPLSPGDYVLCLEPKKKKGLSAKWAGPFQILKKLGNLTYLLDTGHGRTRKRHRNALKPYKPDVVDVCSLITALPDEEAGDGLSLGPQTEERDTEDKDWSKTKGLTSLSQDKQQELVELLERYQDIFRDVPVVADFPPYSLDTGDCAPISQHPYRPGLMWKDKIKQEIEGLMKDGIVRPSHSPWSSPVMAVPKQDGSVRVCVDFRAINKHTKRDRYPLPRIDELLAKVGKASFLTTLDLSKGYHQVPLTADTMPKTAFITQFGKFEYTRLPFGLVNAPAYFQRLMDQTLTNHPADAYIDDIVLADQDWNTHLANLESVLKLAREKNMSLKWKKCHFADAKLNFLGHEVGSGQILPQSIKVEAILDFPRPETKKNLLSFLGLVGYYRAHIPNFSSLSARLSDLTKRNQPDIIQWTEQLEKDFQDVKQSITVSPILSPPDVSQPYHLYTDASGVGLGAVLKQTQQDQMVTIGFYSYKLKPEEKHYSVIELEAYAVVSACKHFSAYLSGADFTIHTDHRALKFLHCMKNSCSRLMRWAMVLQPFHYQVEHMAGRLNGEADSLSRTWDNTLPTSGPFKRGGMLGPATWTAMPD